ncbi:uncharacterized protein BP5553_01406 [Venustampulla echinocandica]|uniref:Uncharacterized protein n=1 Tax=Venustampulla echinocandica TaxID=2656787 RepID=A0A370U0Y1_9HELO|nr:uncharacterized protein BP5553_01406 [Venustampulla echinocandica]RDL41427.1 hypothetical protein BP5553_01406 [Venustampulla echinocandica]
MDEIEHLAQSDPKEKAKFSPWVARVFSDLGLIARVRHELDIYQPWAASFDYEYAFHRDAIEKDFPRRVALLSQLERHFKELSVAKVGSPTENRFFYPSDKRRTKQTAESMRKAEYNLDLFWEKVDGHYRRKTGKSLDEAVQHIFTEARQLERTPEWVEPIQEIKATIPVNNKNGLQEPLSVPRFEPTDSPLKFVSPRLKIKSKKRGSAQDYLSTIQDTPLLEKDPQPIFTLKTRAFKVFKALFYNSSQSDIPGEISWADFLYAMASTGFGPEKLYGSVWQFTPSTLDVERSIHFHEPHPIGKIPLRNARRIGRRLSRAYGWHAGMFAVE